MSEPLADQLYAASPTDGATTAPVYRRVLATAFQSGDGKIYERWFRDAIAANPELVIDPCRACELTDDEWYLWQTEFGVADGDGRSIGSIDVLLISSTGRIGIVETKLAYNPEVRRGVLAQVLDYAVHLPELDLDQMPPIPAAARISEDDVAAHLTRGDFLLVIAGDQMDPRAVKLSRAIVGDHMVNEWDLALVDVSVYERTVGDGPAFLIVPTVRGTVVSETRNIVRVAVSAEGRPPRVEVIRVPPPGNRRSWSEEKFFTELGAATVGDDFKALATRVRALVERMPDRLSLSTGTGTTGSITLKRQDSGLIELYLNGTLRFRHDKIRKGLGDRAEEYLSELRRLFPGPMKKDYPQVPATGAAAVAVELAGLIERIAAREEPSEA